MQICVCGWYYPLPFYERLRAIDGRHDVVVVANRPDHAWDGAADVLFLQDDTRVTEPFWEEIAAIRHDQAFIFRDRAEFEAAYSHGRAHFTSARFLALVRAHGGIWFDAGNRGFLAAGVERQVYSENVRLGRRGTVRPWRSPTPGSSPSGPAPAQATASPRSSACSATPT